MCVDGIAEPIASLIRRCMASNVEERPNIDTVCDVLCWRSVLLDIAIAFHSMRLPILVLIHIFDQLDRSFPLLDLDEKWQICASASKQ